MVTQVTDEVRSGRLAKGLDFIGDITLRKEARSKGFSYSRADGTLLDQESRGPGCQTVPVGEREGSPGSFWRAHQRKLGEDPSLAGEATGQPDRETVSLFPGWWSDSPFCLDLRLSWFPTGDTFGDLSGGPVSAGI